MSVYRKHRIAVTLALYIAAGVALAAILYSGLVQILMGAVS